MGNPIKEMVNEKIKTAQEFKSRVSDAVRGESIDELKRNVEILASDFLSLNERSKIDSRRQWHAIRFANILNIVVLVVAIISIILHFI